VPARRTPPTSSGGREGPRALGVDRLLAGKRVVICGGPGGVGKTTTSAAIAAGMAAQGLRVAVVTIDPARRLANALGLERLGNEPRLVDPARFAERGVEMRGELWALMLDSKRTFDALIDRVAPNEKARDEVLSNRIYQELSSAVAGSQEFTAIAKLYDLTLSDEWDLLVLDTPPSRNALDFLDAPDRLTGFLQGRAIRMFLRPAGIGGRVLGAGTGVVFGVLRRVTGVDLLEDLSTFFRAMGGMVDQIAERGRHVKALLADPATTFLLVTSPERDPVEEAIFFHRRLREQDLPFGGLVVNRIRPEVPAVDDALPGALSEELGEDLARRVAESAAEVAALAERDAANIAHLRRALADPPVISVPQLPGDVHDVDGLVHLCEHLFGVGASTAS
jgi:anion-transporting  ArsA/GET3 family ATPase